MLLTFDKDFGELGPLGSGELRYRTIPFAGAQSSRCRQYHHRDVLTSRDGLARTFFCRRAGTHSRSRPPFANVSEKLYIGRQSFALHSLRAASKSHNCVVTVGLDLRGTEFEASIWIRYGPGKEERRKYCRRTRLNRWRRISPAFGIESRARLADAKDIASGIRRRWQSCSG